MGTMTAVPGGLVWIRKLQPLIADLFPSEGSLEWEVKQNKRNYIAGGALYEIGGRLLADPAAFRRIALELGARKLAARHSVNPPPSTV